MHEITYERLVNSTMPQRRSNNTAVLQLPMLFINHFKGKLYGKDNEETQKNNISAHVPKIKGGKSQIFL